MKVKDLLNSPERWTKGAMVRDERGVNRGERHGLEIGYSFCLWGAIKKIYGDKRFEIENRILPIIHLRTDWKHGSITGFNDDPATKFEDIQAVIDEGNI